MSSDPGDTGHRQEQAEAGGMQRQTQSCHQLPNWDGLWQLYGFSWQKPEQACRMVIEKRAEELQSSHQN